MTSATHVIAALIVSGLPLLPAAAAARDVDLRDTYVAKLTGAGQVGGGGDFDGDARSDVVTTYAIADPMGRDEAGVAYVALGPRRGSSTNLRRDGYRGFRIVGASANDNVSDACVAGDLNGDGRDDLVVGAQGADTPNGGYSGAAYVIFGSTDASDVDLADFHDNAQGDRGFRVDGGSAFDLAGLFVACLGDVNLDGIADFAVAAPFAGATYVVFGKADTRNVDLRLFDLNAQGPAGFRIETPVPDSNGQYGVGALGDVNDDGRPDVGVGVYVDAHESPGTAYVVFGKSDPAPVDVETGSHWGYRIAGAAKGDATGEVVTGAGDFNGDGIADVAVGAPRTYTGRPGRVYVVYGSREPYDVELGALGDRGTKIRGGPNRDSAGSALAGVGDTDGDGYDDLLIGAMWAMCRSRQFAGAAYLVRGGPSPDPVRLRDLGRRGYAICGDRAGDEIGGSLAAYVDDRTEEPRFLIGGFRRLKTYVVSPRPI